MAFYSLNLMRIALELAMHNPVYEAEHSAVRYVTWMLQGLRL